MQTLAFTADNPNFEALLDKVANNQEATIISRQGTQDLVVMSLDYYTGLMETLHLLSSPKNAKHLEQSITQYLAGKTKERELINE